MRNLRALIATPIYYLAFVAITVICGAILLFSIWNYGAVKKIVYVWSAVLLWVLRYVCGIKYQCEFEATLDPKRAVIYLSKHQSSWETIAYNVFFDTPVFVAKAQLKKIPIFGWGLGKMRTIFIDRSAGISAYKKVIQQGKKLIQSGLSIMLFPEGTRVAPGEHPMFHRTGVALAQSIGADIIPLAVNAGVCWPKKSFLIRSGTITVKVGAPIASKGLKVNELNQQVYDWIKHQMSQLEQVHKAHHP